MKHIFYILTAILALSLSSCATTRITYGDISVLNTEGKTIRQWNNCSMEEEVSHYNAQTNTVQTTRYYYGIKRNEGLSFMDSLGETHYVSGGIIIVDNIHTEYQDDNYEKTYNQSNADELNEELKIVTGQIAELNKKLKSHKPISPGEYHDKQVELKQLRQRKTQIENLLREKWRLD